MAEPRSMSGGAPWMSSELSAYSSMLKCRASPAARPHINPMRPSMPHLVRQSSSYRDGLARSNDIHARTHCLVSRSDRRARVETTPGSAVAARAC